MHTTNVLLRLLDKTTVPPSDTQGRHFRYRHAETGHVSSGADYYSWMTNAKAHRRANSLQIPADFAAQAEDQMCKELPPEWCAQDPDGVSRVDTGFSLGDVVDWIKAVTNRFISGEPLVSQEEANRRARICSQCTMNMNTGGCGSGCAKLVKYFTPGMVARSTPFDDLLKACGICRCANKIQAWFPLSILLPNETSEKEGLYPTWCWKKPGGENFMAEAA